MSADKSIVSPPLNEKKGGQRGTTRRKGSRSPGASKDPAPSKQDGPKTAASKTQPSKTIDEAANKKAWAKNTLKLSCKTLSDEFNTKIRKYADPRLTTVCSVKNEAKNRYADVLCLDDTRVVLKGRKVEDDYIHANWVKNPDGSRLICTQGPLAETIEDFWLMAVKEKACMILQLCQFFEGENNEKCAAYLPTKEKETKTFGPFKVQNLSTLSEPDIEGCVASNIEITYEKKKVRLRHLLVSSWPDQCAPVSSDNVLALWKWVKKETKHTEDPVIVHCSAGIGRTATYAAIEVTAARIGKNPDASLMAVVKEMRTMRFQAVQSYVQYLFLHLIMLDLFVSEKLIDKYDPEGKFIKEYKRMAQRKITKMAKKESEAGKGAGGKKCSNLEDDQPC